MFVIERLKSKKKKMSDQQETWFIFDLDPHIDPNFVAWLGSLGVIVKFNVNGARGAIAQTSDKLPFPVDLSYYSANDLPSITLSCTQALPNDFSNYFEEGKQTIAYTRRLIHSGSDNYGRSRPEPPKCSNPECWQRWEERCREWDERSKG